MYSGRPGGRFLISRGKSMRAAHIIANFHAVGSKEYHWEKIHDGLSQ
jgi:hypothetical protein